MLKNSFNFSLTDNLTNTTIDLLFNNSTRILSSKYLFNNDNVLTKVKFQMEEFNFGKDISYFCNILYDDSYKYTRIDKICNIELDKKNNKYIYTLKSDMEPVFTNKSGAFQTDICYLNRYNENDKPIVEYIKNSRVFFNKLIRLINNGLVKFKSKEQVTEFVNYLRIYFKINIVKQQVHNKIKISRQINDYIRDTKRITDPNMYSENFKNYEIFSTADIDIGNIYIEQLREPLQILRDYFNIQYSNAISEYRKDGNHWTITFKNLKNNEQQIIRDVFRLCKIIIDPSCTFYGTSKNLTGLSCHSYITKDIDIMIKKSKFNYELRNSQQLINLKINPLNNPPEGRNRIYNDNITALNNLINKLNKNDIKHLTILINKIVNKICDKKYLIRNLDLIENHDSEKEKFYNLYFKEIKEFIIKSDYTLGIFVKNKKLIKNRIFDSLETKWNMTEEKMNEKRKSNKSKKYYKNIIGNKYRYQRKENKLINKFKKNDYQYKMLKELNLKDYHLLKNKEFKFSNINDIRQKDKLNRQKLIISDIIDNENILNLCNSQKRKLLKELKRSLNYKSTKNGIRNFLNEAFDRLCVNGLDKDFGILKSNLYKYKKDILNWLIKFIEECYIKFNKINYLDCSFKILKDLKRDYADSGG